jgi:hypothetical protein
VSGRLPGCRRTGHRGITDPTAQSLSLTAGVTGLLRQNLGGPDARAENRYGCAVDVQRAADLYAQGRSLGQLGAELGVPWTAVGHQLRRAGVTIRRGGPPAHPASTQQILELRDEGLTWAEVQNKLG